MTDPEPGTEEAFRPRPGLRVLVTAGAAGIGREIAEAFLRNRARVFVCDIDDDALAGFRADHPEAGALRADVAVQAEVDALFDAAERELGGLDVLVNNAGIAGPTTTVEAMDPDDWRRTVDINLNGQFYCLRRAVPLLKQSDDASIVALSSVAGRGGRATAAARGTNGPRRAAGVSEVTSTGRRAESSVAHRPHAAARGTLAQNVRSAVGPGRRGRPLAHQTPARGIGGCRSDRCGKAARGHGFGQSSSSSCHSRIFE